MHFIAYPLTPGMGLRESINAVLAHVAYNGRPFGYLPSIAHESNFIALRDTWGDLLVGEVDDEYLTLAPVVSDSSALAVLVDDLLGLCNDYPVYDGEIYHEIEYERTLEELYELLDDSIAPCAHCIARQLFENGAEIEQSEYGASISEDDFTLAVETATCDH